MLIKEELLLAYGAEIDSFDPNDIIFNEADKPRYYYQIISGRIKLNHYNEAGKELILAILHKGLSVCELLLFIDKSYPVNAIVLEPSRVIKLPKKNFFQMMDENQEISRDVNKFLSERLYYKFIMLENNSSLNAEVRIKGVMDYHKSFYTDQSAFSFEIPLTRQQLASITGLRVETVIRTIKNLEKHNVVKIRNGKILY
ncbi:Crp/Fnr family transcriptional regulator [Epilithonimonas mollis]|uniref:cAMP-binding domain of CRP or a regulatory subunit of cAMP-dependent protein kinases n=1 Tax=Epilithonimonas mollis TaxID=216903 RepID=A0A1M6NM58_9FLAO|nr:Crp/Fnr family transcriptional regulator [Epilithonimonas mollis]SHJ96788.1 cAMP-binding domain of CRP or a regulatory subunit of cAMP-dependent protein kinases [Epilithonimonas mollis]